MCPWELLSFCTLLTPGRSAANWVQSRPFSGVFSTVAAGSAPAAAGAAAAKLKLATSVAPARN